MLMWETANSRWINDCYVKIVHCPIGIEFVSLSSPVSTFVTLKHYLKCVALVSKTKRGNVSHSCFTKTFNVKLCLWDMAARISNLFSNHTDSTLTIGTKTRRTAVLVVNKKWSEVIQQWVFACFYKWGSLFSLKKNKTLEEARKCVVPETFL